MRLFRRAASVLIAVVATWPAHAADAISIPDFSGVWGHLVFPDVEPPLSGPGPVRNLLASAGSSAGSRHAEEMPAGVRMA